MSDTLFDPFGDHDPTTDIEAAQKQRAALDKARHLALGGDFDGALHEIEALRADRSDVARDPQEAFRAAGYDVAALTAAIQAARSTPRLAVLVDCEDAAPAPVLWQERTGPGAPVLSVGEVAVLAGPGGMGKSTLMLAVAAAAGAPDDYGTACGLCVRTGPVVIASYEDSPARMAHRLQWYADGVDASGEGAGQHVLVWPQPRPLYRYDDNQRVAQQSPEWSVFWRLVREASASLVVIDPVSVALLGVSMSDSGAVRDFIDSVTREAERARVGVLLVGHDTKGARNEARTGGDPGAGAVAGSAAWYDGARGVLYLWREPGTDTLIVEAIKSNYGPTGWGVRLAPRWADAEACTGWRGLRGDGGLTVDEVADARKNGWKRAASRGSSTLSARAAGLV